MERMLKTSEEIVVATVANIIPIVLRAVARTTFRERHPLLAVASVCEATSSIEEALVAMTAATAAFAAVTPKMGSDYDAGRISEAWLAAVYADNRPLAASLIGYGDHQWAVFQPTKSALYFVASATAQTRIQPVTTGWEGMEPASIQKMGRARIAVQHCQIAANAVAQAVAVYDPAICFLEGEDWKWAQALEAGAAKKAKVESAFAKILGPWTEFEPTIAAHAAMVPLLDEAFQ